MKNCIAITFLSFSNFISSFDIDLKELRQLCINGDYNTALTKLDEMNMPEAAKEADFNPENEFFLLCSEVYENTLAKEKIKQLAEYYQTKAEQDKTKWSSLTVILVSSYRCNEQYTEAQDLCIANLIEKTKGNKKKKELKSKIV